LRSRRRGVSWRSALERSGAGGATARAQEELWWRASVRAGAGTTGRTVATSWDLVSRDLLCRRAAAAHARHGPMTHAARACTDGVEAQQGRGERVSSSRKRTSSCAACRTTVCREVARGAGGGAVRWLRADSHGCNRAARGKRRRPLRRRQRTRSGGTANCSRRI
jgi:hypothetical protein